LKIVKRILLVIFAFVVAVCLYLLIIAVIPGLEAPPQPLKNAARLTAAASSKQHPAKFDVSFSVRDTLVSAWLYLPADKFVPAPCIIMAHGLGGTRAMGLGDYALRFQEAGFAVLVFDYRYFGESAGKPRQLIWIADQLEDWAVAVSYARSRKEINPDKIALWGTSLSGGHVLVTAAQDKRIACVTAQCPGLDGREAAEMAFAGQTISHSLRLLMHGQRDLVRSWLGLSPHKVPIVGKPGTIALLTAGKAYDAFVKLAPDDFINEACARIIIRGDKYMPIKYAPDIRCPVLLQLCEKDEIVPPASGEETGRILGKYADIRRYPIGHFDIYFGENLAKSISDQIAFYKKYL